MFNTGRRANLVLALPCGFNPLFFGKIYSAEKQGQQLFFTCTEVLIGRIDPIMPVRC